MTLPEIVEVFGRSPNQVDFAAQETHHLCHLSKSVSQLLSNFLMEGQQMGPKIGLPYALN